MPPSANAHELFRGFSFVAPSLIDESISDSDETLIDTQNTTTKSPEGATSETVSKILSCTITKCKERSLNDYEFLEELGKGSYSCCRRCIHKETKKQYAVKVNFQFKKLIIR